MKYRILGKTGFEISELSLGTWQVGGKWGEPFSHSNADKILNSAIDQGINFIDTADVYGDGESEKAVGRIIKSRTERIFVATKCGRRLAPHTSKQYTPEAIRGFVESSLKNMNLETLDLIQLHCPPTQVYYRPEIFEVFDKLKSEGKIQHLGVSVEKIEEGIKAIEYPNVSSVQIIFNIFRQRPKELFFDLARKKNVGIIVRVPLASGLLTGKFDENTSFSQHDHRNFNRDGRFFDKGETFSGIDFNSGLSAVNSLKTAIRDMELVSLALKWILMHPEISCVIPGASTPHQVMSNIKAIEGEKLTDGIMTNIDSIYSEYIKPQVHHLW